MTEVEPVLDFASSGRSGRRNALPDILGSPAGVNPGDLPLKLAELSLKGEAPDAFFFIITTLSKMQIQTCFSDIMLLFNLDSECFTAREIACHELWSIF